MVRNGEKRAEGRTQPWGRKEILPVSNQKSCALSLDRVPEGQREIIAAPGKRYSESGLAPAAATRGGEGGVVGPRLRDWGRNRDLNRESRSILPGIPDDRGSGVARAAACRSLDE